MEVSRLRSGRLSKQKKNYPFNAVWTSECSWRAAVAPAGWTSSGLRAPHTGGWAGGPNGTCRGHWLIPLLKKKLTTFLDSCMSSLRLSMLFFSVSFKRIMFVILTQGPCSPVLVLTWRSSYADTVGEGVNKTGKSSGQCTVEIPVQSTAREFHTSLPYRRTSPLVNNFLNPAIHSSKLHTQKKTCHLRGHAAQKKTQYVLFL